MKKFLDLLREYEEKEIDDDQGDELEEAPKLKSQPSQSLSTSNNHSSDNHTDDITGLNTATATQTQADNSRYSNMDALGRNRAMRHLSDLMASNIGNDTPQNPENLPAPQNPENLPAVISKAVAETGGKFNPKWHMVKNLPGNMIRAVRVLGKAVFDQYTNTPINQIQVISSFTNSKMEVDAMANWIKENADSIEPGNIDFSAIMPGYDADVVVCNSRGYEFMIVKDFAGHYIYAWPGKRKISN